MTFVRRKGTSYYLVESRRAGARVKQTVIVYLGPCSSLASALNHWSAELERIQPNAIKYRADCEARRRELDPVRIQQNGGMVPPCLRKRLEFARDPFKQYWQVAELARVSEARAEAITERLAIIRKYLTDDLRVLAF